MHRQQTRQLDREKIIAQAPRYKYISLDIHGYETTLPVVAVWASIKVTSVFPIFFVKFDRRYWLYSILQIRFVRVTVPSGLTVYTLHNTCNLRRFRLQVPRHAIQHSASVHGLLYYCRLCYGNGVAQRTWIYITAPQALMFRLLRHNNNNFFFSRAFLACKSGEAVYHVARQANLRGPQCLNTATYAFSETFLADRQVQAYAIGNPSVRPSVRL